MQGTGYLDISNLSSIDVPSGQDLRFLEHLKETTDDGQTLSRFRFVATAISRVGGTVDFETVTKDMAYLCADFVMKKLLAEGPKPDMVIVSVSDRPIALGETVPEATQFFDAFRIEGDLCIWEPF